MIDPTRQLRERARMILLDRCHVHSQDALRWARQVLLQALPSAPERDGHGFSDRELSLGAQESWN